MRLVRVTDTLYVNPERVISVEQRTIDNGRGEHTFVELTLETQTRWKLEQGLHEVLQALSEALS